MKATRVLTVKQPWAWSIIYAGKDIENRSQPLPTTIKPGEKLLIHAGKSFDTEGMNYFPEIFKKLPREKREKILSIIPQDEDKFTYGKIIGIVEVVKCVTESKSPWFTGPYGIVIKDPMPVKPIPIVGQLGYWNYKGEYSVLYETLF